jgi:hypothetical protein
MKVFIVVYYQLPHWNMLQHMASLGYRPNFRHTPICFHFSWNNGARVDQPRSKSLKQWQWDGIHLQLLNCCKQYEKTVYCTYCMNRSKSDLRNYEVTISALFNLVMWIAEMWGIRLWVKSHGILWCSHRNFRWDLRTFIPHKYAVLSCSLFFWGCC